MKGAHCSFKKAGVKRSGPQSGEVPEQRSALSHGPSFGRHTTLESASTSAGQSALVPVQVSTVSQTPAATRQMATADKNASSGQLGLDPSHVSPRSQSPAAGRQTAPAAANASGGQSIATPSQDSSASQRSVAGRQTVPSTATSSAGASERRSVTGLLGIACAESGAAGRAGRGGFIGGAGSRQADFGGVAGVCCGATHSTVAIRVGAVGHAVAVVVHLIPTVGLDGPPGVHRGCVRPRGAVHRPGGAAQPAGAAALPASGARRSSGRVLGVPVGRGVLDRRRPTRAIVAGVASAACSRQTQPNRDRSESPYIRVYART